MKTTIKTANSVASIVAAAVILGWAATASTAHAADAPQPWLNKTVTYGDLKLETQKGARILFARLQLAAKDVCARIEGSTDPAVRSHWLRCYDSALAAAVKQVNNGSVNALYLHAMHAPQGREFSLGERKCRRRLCRRRFSRLRRRGTVDICSTSHS
jgi:UrcA family protein